MIISGYQLVGRVAVSSGGGVWKARDLGLGRDVAVKELAVGNGNREVLRAEAAVLAALHDEHIVTVYDLVEQDGTAYLVEEWIEGVTLAAVLRSRPALSVEQALAVLRGALQGLAAAHHDGIVHGDISPANIMLDVEGTTKLIDFGLAAVAGSGTRAGSGTSGYDAPELRTGGSGTTRSDVYSAAAVLAELVGGRVSGLLDPASPRAASGTALPIGRDLLAVLDKAASTDPESRYGDAGAFLDALDAAVRNSLAAGWWRAAGLAGIVAGTTGATLSAVVAADAVVAPEVSAVAQPATRTAPPSDSAADVPAATSGSARPSGHSIGAPDRAAAASRSARSAVRGVKGMTKAAKLWAAVGSVAAVAAAAGITVAVMSSASDNTATAADTITTTSVEAAPVGTAGSAAAPDSTAVTSGSAATDSAATPATGSGTVELTGTGQSDPSGAPDSAATGNPFAGTYSFTRTVVDDGGRADSVVGTSDSGEFTVTAACDAPSCALTTDFGAATVSGSTLSFSGTTQEPCPDDAAISITDSWTITLQSTGTQEIGGVQKVTGFTGVNTVAVSDMNGCNGQNAPLQSSITAERTG